MARQHAFLEEFLQGSLKGSLHGLLKDSVVAQVPSLTPQSQVNIGRLVDHTGNGHSDSIFHFVCLSGARLSSL